MERSLQETRANEADWPNSERLFAIRASETCRRQRDTHYTPGLASFSGVLNTLSGERSIFNPREALCACEPDSQ